MDLREGFLKSPHKQIFVAAALAGVLPFSVADRVHFISGDGPVFYTRLTFPQVRA
jgi:hypothetical protein